MSTKHFLIICILFPGFTGIFAQKLQEWDLDSCWKRAVEAHPLSGDAVLIRSSTALKVRSLSSAFLPAVELGAQATYQSDVVSIDLDLGLPGVEFPAPTRDQYRVYLDLHQTIYDGGSVRLQKELEQARAGAETGQTRVSLHQVRQMVSEVYFMILLLQEQEKVLMLSDTLLQERIRLARSAVENGVLTTTDFLDLQAEQYSLRQEMEEVRFNLLSARGVLAELLGVEEESIGALRLLRAEVDPESPVRRPELDLMDARLEGLEKTSLLLKTRLRPKLVAFGQAGYGRPGLNMLSDEFDPYFMVGARLSWNIFDGYRTRMERQRVRVEADRLTLQQETFTEQVQRDLIRQRNEAEKYRHLLDTDREILALRQELTRSAASRLGQGVITSAEYLLVWHAEKTARIREKTHRVMLARTIAEMLLTLGMEKEKP
ncbi:MAG TPA: TolC family protein [Bacteroidetes bacterium]|nr:TolC family protein [Bacteroidota bacterium]